MKGFIKVTVIGNSAPVIVNVETIAQVWSDNPTISEANIKLTTKNSQGNHDILRVGHAVWIIEEMMKEALKEKGAE